MGFNSAAADEESKNILKSPHLYSHAASINTNLTKAHPL